MSARFLVAAVSSLAVALSSSGSAWALKPAGRQPILASANRAGLPPVTLSDVGLDASAMDKTAKPCDDFYRYACGNWQRNTSIPADEASWYRSFDEIQKHNDLELKQILDVATLTKSADPVTQKLGQFYGACSVALSTEPTLLQLPVSMAATDKVGLLQAVAKLHLSGIHPFFRWSIDPDFADATKLILWLDQGGLGLPDRDDYLRDDDKSKQLRAAYFAHIGRIFNHFKAQVPANAAQTVVRIETALAQMSKTVVERRDPKGMYNKVDKAGLVALAPALDWKTYFITMNLHTQDQLAVTSTPFFSGLSALIGQESLADLQLYVHWVVYRSTAPHWSAPSSALAFQLERSITGQPQQKPVWRRCLDATDTALGDLLAQPYVEKRFGEQAQNVAADMVRAIAAAFTANLDTLEWMDAATKAKAAEKASKIAYLIGRPKVWRTYEFALGPVHLDNVLAGRRAENLRTIGKLGKPVDREEWLMSAPTVNAYYDPQKNLMVFPAGILQPPFFDPKAALAVNFGAIGLVIGHELTHGFDDEGSQFDAVGNFAQWWQPQTRKAFDAKTACVANQFDLFEVQPGLKINGKLTTGENSADLGGLKLALAAYKALPPSARAERVADGYTAEQQFFLAHAQVWCAQMRPDAERQLVLTNPHSPPKFRVLGPLQNTPAFASAFGCKTGAVMAPKDRCAVW